MYKRALEQKKVVIFSDGACKGNPGVGGYGVVMIFLYKGELVTKRLNCAYKLTTNNRMELLGAIVALEALKHPSQVELYTDSGYIVNTINKNWKRKTNHDLWARLDAQLAIHEVKFFWVKGHAGDKYNEECDALANEAIAKNVFLEDDGYSKTNNNRGC